MSRQLESVDHFEDRGKVAAACGHKVDVRKLVYVHIRRQDRPVAVTTMCPKCSDALPVWDGRK